MRVRVRRRRVNLRKLRRQRRLAIAMMFVGAAILLSGAWLAYTALQARSELTAVRDGVRELRAQLNAGDLATARRTAKSLESHATEAHDLTTGPVWATAASLPGGQPLSTVRQISQQVDVLARDVLPPLIDASTSLDPATLRRADGSIDTARIARIAPVLDKASSRLGDATTAVAREPAHTWIGTVDTARFELLDQLDSLGKTLRSATLASRIAPPLLGADGVKRYFVAFQNNAEARGTGGLPGAFGILRVEQGRFRFERFEPDGTLGVVKTDVDFGADYKTLFTNARTTSLYINSNLSPHFPYAAQIWQAMWRKYSGEKLDGAFAVDPEVLSYLLESTGPVTLADGTKVADSNVVGLTQSTIYQRFPKDQDARKKFLLELARAVSTHVLTSKASPTALVKAGARAAGERRILMYSDDPAVQRDISQTSLSGEIPQTSAPYAGFSVVNNGGNKLDYYLDRSISWTRSGCGDDHKVTATIRVTNNAPTGLPKYVTSRTDRRDFTVRPGDQSLEISYYATDGARLTGVRLNGKVAAVRINRDLGHPVYTLDVEVPRGTTRELQFSLTEPAGDGPVQVLRQPLVRPLQVSVKDTSCGN